MAFFSGMVGVAVFAFTAAMVCGVVFLILGTVYITPFCLWLGSQQGKGKYKHLDSRYFPKTFRYATHLYKHFLFHTELTF